MMHFTPFIFDSSEARLFRGAEELPLTRKAAALLSCLMSARGQWVSKDDILSTVWPDTHVHPDNVKVLVREIRQALGDEPKAARFISSAPKRGYAFVAPLSETMGPAEGLAAARTPIFVNRGPELAALADALDAARASLRRLVLLSGEHGIGKSALCAAFLRTAQAGGPLRVCYGQSIDRDSPQEPYYPFLDAFLRLDRLHRGIMPELLASVAPSWLAHFPQWGGVRTGPIDDAAMRAELTAVLDALSQTIPLVVVLEDLQWADTETILALTHLAAIASPAKLLVVGSYCPGEWTAGDRIQRRLTTFGGASPRRVMIDLAPLTLEHVARYVDARFGPNCLSELAAAVHHATSGNPYMIVNAFDSLVARGLVVLGANGWRRQASIEAIARELPETLAAAIAQQLEQLDGREREALEAASAIGLEFTSSSVSVVLGWPIEAVRVVLGSLARRGQLIVPIADPRSGRSPHDAYRFRHPLHADVIAQRAPMLRQLRLTERVSSARSDARLARRRA